MITFSELQLDILDNIQKETVELQEFLNAQLTKEVYAAIIPEFISGLNHYYGWSGESSKLSESSKHPHGPLGLICDTLESFNEALKAKDLEALIRCANELDTFDFHCQYAAQENPPFQEWSEGEGDEIISSIRSLGGIASTLKNLKNLPLFDQFLDKLSHNDPADVNIISIGCGGKTEQQVYPWVWDLVHRYPNLAIHIHVFDKFGSESERDPSLQVGAYAGIPDIVALDSLQQKEEWLSTGEHTWQHQMHKNLSIHSYDAFFPLYEGQYRTAKHVVPKLQACLKGLLDDGKVVVMSAHTGGHALDFGLVTLFNDINTSQSQPNFYYIVETQNEAFIYHQKPVDILEQDFVENSEALETIVSSFSGSLNDLDSQEKQLFEATSPRTMRLLLDKKKSPEFILNHFKTLQPAFEKRPHNELPLLSGTLEQCERLNSNKERSLKRP